MTLVTVLPALVVFNSGAITTHYVDANGTNPISPYAAWATSATNIQDAVDAANPGDNVLVTNGVYATGGRVVSGSLTNRVAINKAITVLSVNGPAVTIIQGHQVVGTITGPGAVRCVFLTNSAVLSGFTLTNGATSNTNGDPKVDQPGGGAYCLTPSSVISNCVLIGNAAYFWGGGAVYGTLRNCVVQGNSASTGGGTYLCQLYNCAVIGNTASGSGGGAARGSLNNCTIISNSASTYGGGFDGSSDGTLNNCIVYFNDAPANANYYRGSFNLSGSVNYCCTVPYSTNGPGNLTNNPVFVNTAGRNLRLQPSSPCINAGSDGLVSGNTDLDGTPRIVGGVVDLGAYEFQSPIHYVKVTSLDPISPYTNWATAAVNIQDAVDAASGGDVVLVTNGVYATGGRKWFDSGTNLVTVTNPIVLLSVNGPTVTLVQGSQAPGTNAVRCVYLAANALLSGFTLTNGAGGIGNYPDGGGVYCQSSGAVVSNCVLTGNFARLGGGAFRGTLVNSLLQQNAATQTGGGAYNAGLINCLVISNSAGVGVSAGDGGGAGYGSLSNCTLVGNSAGRGGGVSFSTANNCILYYNFFKPGGSASNYVSSTLNFCSTTPLPAGGTGNITNDPVLLNVSAGDYHLQSNSPCINSGNNSYVITATDFDGNLRIRGGTVDIGAYEYQTPTSVLSYDWLQHYGLPTDGTADYADSDGDDMNNYQEWIAGTDPTNPLSLLEMLNPSPANNPAGLTLSWLSVTNRNYFVQRSLDLGTQPGFSTIQSNIVGQSGTTTYTDTNMVGGGPFFYRVGVQ
jgi:hypothetical protein